MSGWETDNQGNVIFSVLKRFQVAPAAGIVCMVRIEFQRSPTAEDESLQLRITPAQARQLADDLLKVAEKIESKEGQRPH